MQGARAAAHQANVESKRLSGKVAEQETGLRVLARLSRALRSAAPLDASADLRACVDMLGDIPDCAGLPRYNVVWACLTQSKTCRLS